MKWLGDGDGAWAETTAGTFIVERLRLHPEDRFQSLWTPKWVIGGSLLIGCYRTPGAAKGACKRYAKRMAAAFKAMGKAGWQ